jgi:hypothetical protein
VLLHQPVKPTDQAKGYRPITFKLLDAEIRVDVDIWPLCLVLAQCLHLPLDLLIAAFLGGRAETFQTLCSSTSAQLTG